LSLQTYIKALEEIRIKMNAFAGFEDEYKKLEEVLQKN
jgi:hypothetical protein